MFSPITQRSWRVRSLYIFLYGALLLGSATMVVPFMIMITGSIEPSTETSGRLVPTYLTDRTEMWKRYVSTKYQGTPDLLRTAWVDPEVDFRNLKIPHIESADTHLWEEFLQETQPGPHYSLLGFLRSSRMPSYTGRQFRLWLMKKFGTLEKLNSELGTQFVTQTAIHPPALSLVGPARAKTPLLAQFNEFCATEGRPFLLPWNVGGYYRAVFLPTQYGVDITAFNTKYGTAYASYAEVPFDALVPQVAQSDWFTFVSRILCPDFVQLTESGQAAQDAARISRDEFIRTQARPEHLRVDSLDTRFAEWAVVKHGRAGAVIPQMTLDVQDFEKTEGFWKWQFVTLNYQRVLDEILLHGRAIINTFILVVLSVGGALLVNPLAAYALSRFKLRRTYHILLFCLATIAFPAEVTMIPVFLQLKEFNLLNTFGALVLPGLASGFSIFLLKGFFDSLPKELFEAAELDGASEWTMFWQIAMNLSKPILAVIALGAFAAAYGTFFYALILAPDPKMWTIMVYIYQLRGSVDPPVVYASLILTALPTLLVFIFCQNIILRGIVVPSDK